MVCESVDRNAIRRREGYEMTTWIRHKGWTWGFRSTVLLYFLALIVLPIFGVYVQSFSAGWSHFTESIMDPIAWKAVLTIKLGVISTFINVLIGTMIAWVLIRYKFPGRTALNSLVDLPFALPTAVGGLMIFSAGPRSFLGGLAEKLGFEIVFHQPAIVIAMMFVTFPFVIRAVQPRWRSSTRWRKKRLIRWELPGREPSLKSSCRRCCPGLSAEECWHSQGH